MNPGFTLPPGAVCAQHPERAAARACARCGAFTCAGCLIGEDLCTECKRRLLREGTPWTDQEKARASARRRVRAAERMLRGELVLGGLATVVLVTVASGTLPAALRPLGLGLWALAALMGFAVAASATDAWRQGQRGRPGPAVAGVVSAGEAAQFVVLGALPALALIGPAVSGLRSFVG